MVPDHDWSNPSSCWEYKCCVPTRVWSKNNNMNNQHKDMLSWMFRNSVVSSWQYPATFSFCGTRCSSLLGPPATTHQHKHILHTTSKDRSCCYCYFYFSHKCQNSPRYCHCHCRYSSRPRYHFVLFMKGAFHDSTVASFVQSLIESPTFDSTFISSYTQPITQGCNLLNWSGADDLDEKCQKWPRLALLVSHCVDLFHLHQ